MSQTTSQIFSKTTQGEHWHSKQPPKVTSSSHLRSKKFRLPLRSKSSRNDPRVVVLLQVDLCGSVQNCGKTDTGLTPRLEVARRDILRFEEALDCEVVRTVRNMLVERPLHRTRVGAYPIHEIVFVYRETGLPGPAINWNMTQFTVITKIVSTTHIRESSKKTTRYTEKEKRGGVV